MKNNLQTWILVIIVLIVIGIGIYSLISGDKTIKEGGNVTGNRSEKINESGEEKIVVVSNISEKIGNLTNKSGET